MFALIPLAMLLASGGQSPEPPAKQTESGCDLRVLLTDNAGAVLPWVAKVKVSLEDASTGKPFHRVEPKTGRIDICDTEFRIFRIRVEGPGREWLVKGDYGNMTGRPFEVRIVYPGTVEEHLPPLMPCRVWYRLTDGEGKPLQGRMRAEGGTRPEVILTNEFGRIMHRSVAGMSGVAVFSAPGFEDVRLPWSCTDSGERAQNVVLKTKGSGAR